MSQQQVSHQRMKHRRSLLSLTLLPTITETLEDAPVHLPGHPSTLQRSQTLEDYMNSIQALARPAEVVTCSPRRPQRSHRLKQGSRMRISRSLRTSSLTDSHDFSDCRGKDPVDWLFGQIRT